MVMLDETEVATIDAQDSAPCRRVVSTAALQTLVFVSFCNFVVVPDTFVYLPKALFTLVSQLSISLSILAINVITHPKSLKWWTAFSSGCSMAMSGGWYSSCGAG